MAPMTALTPDELKELEANFQRVMNVMCLWRERIQEQDPEMAEMVYCNAEAASRQYYENALAGVPGFFEVMSLIADLAEQSALKASLLAKMPTRTVQ